MTTSQDELAELLRREMVERLVVVLVRAKKARRKADRSAEREANPIGELDREIRLAIQHAYQRAVVRTVSEGHPPGSTRCDHVAQIHQRHYLKRWLVDVAARKPELVERFNDIDMPKRLGLKRRDGDVLRRAAAAVANAKKRERERWDSSPICRCCGRPR